MGVVGGFSWAVRRSRLIPEEQLECSRRSAGICVYRGHPGLTRLLWREQNPGYITSTSTTQNTETLKVRLLLKECVGVYKCVDVHYVLYCWLFLKGLVHIYFFCGTQK